MLFMLPGIEPHSGPGWRHLGRSFIQGPELCVLSSSGSFLLPRARVPRASLPPSSILNHLPSCHPLPFSVFLSSPASLDAFVFSYLALLLQAKLPSGKLQAHLRGLHNLCTYCAHILSIYFPWDGGKETEGGQLWEEWAAIPRLASLPFLAHS